MANNALLERIPFLQEEHFYSMPHGRLFTAITQKIQQGIPANPLTLRVQFENDPDFALTGRGQYLTEALAAAIRVLAPIEHARYLCELAQRRSLHAACTHAANVLEADTEEPPAETAIKLAKEFEQVSRGFATPRIFDDYEIGAQILEDLKDQKRPHSTGLSRLDNAMGGGLYPGKAYGFAARKKIGKTVLASTISCNLNQAGVKHLFVCGEMSPKEIHQRNLSRLTDSFPSAFRSDYGQSPAFQRKLSEEILRSGRNILYYNAPSLTFDELRRVMVTAALSQGIKGIILDYWQLVGGKGKKGMTEHLDEVAQWIADNCRKYDIWAIVMAQLNQEGNTRGGEGIRLAFDQVYVLDRPDLTAPYGHLEMIETRYTEWGGVGCKEQPGLYMHSKGPYFEQMEDVST